jgi:hypothetical protein
LWSRKNLARRQRLWQYCLYRVPLQLRGRSVVLEAELADVDLWQGAEVVGVGALIPDLHLEASHLQVAGLPGVREAPHVVLDHLARLGLGLAEDLEVPLRGESGLKKFF